MIKQQIQQLLSAQKVNSISDIVFFVIQQVHKTLNQQPMEQIYFRLSQLQKPKGLDVIMIEEVKTIVQAMIDQRQENLRQDFDKNLNDQFENIEFMISNLNFNSKKERKSLGQVDMINFLNTNSFANGIQEELRKNREKYKQNPSQTSPRDNLMNDSVKIMQKIQKDKKQIDELKFSIMQINRQNSNKITVQQAHSIITDFQGKMYQKIQNQRLQLQKIQFRIKKQIQQQILRLRKQTLIDIDFQGLKREILSNKRGTQKFEKKFNKYKQQTKCLSKGFDYLQHADLSLEKQLQTCKKQFQEYCKFNDSKNVDLNVILEQINRKLEYFDKINSLEHKVDTMSLQMVKAQWLTQCRTKNQNIVWQKEVYNTQPGFFKFQPQKSQIIIIEPSIYLVQFTLLESRTTNLSGSIFIQSFGLELNKKELKLSGNNSLKFMIEICQKSLISLKLVGGQSNGGIGGRGILKISKY